MSLTSLTPGCTPWWSILAGRTPQPRACPSAAPPTVLALALGNALVGNPPDAAALEISLAGPTLQSECPWPVSSTEPPFP